MERTVRPTKDRILCKIHEEERRLKSGIIVPQLEFDFNPKSDAGTRATVLEVGPWQMEVKPGDEVLVEKLGGIEIQINGEEFVMFDPHEVLAIVKEEKWEWIGKAITNG